VVVRNLHNSPQQELMKEESERLGHKIRNRWIIKHRVTGYPLSLFFSGVEIAANDDI
jgi:hypothetical protein